MSFVFHFDILELTAWIWTSPSKWNSYEGFNLELCLYCFFIPSIDECLDVAYPPKISLDSLKLPKATSQHYHLHTCLCCTFPAVVDTSNFSRRERERERSLKSRGCSFFIHECCLVRSIRCGMMLRRATSMALDLCTQWGRQDEPISANPSSLELPDTTKELVFTEFASMWSYLILRLGGMLFWWNNSTYKFHGVAGYKGFCCQGLYLQLDLGGPLESEEGTPFVAHLMMSRHPHVLRDPHLGETEEAALPLLALPYLTLTPPRGRNTNCICNKTFHGKAKKLFVFVSTPFVEFSICAPLPQILPPFQLKWLSYFLDWIFCVPKQLANLFARLEIWGSTSNNFVPNFLSQWVFWRRNFRGRFWAGVVVYFKNRTYIYLVNGQRTLNLPKLETQTIVLRWRE